MSNLKLMRKKMADNYKNNCRYFDENEQKVKSQKCIFRANPSKPKKKELMDRTSIMYRSFINSSAPFNYFPNPTNDPAQKSLLVCFNGGPQKKVILSKNVKDLSDKEIVYTNNRKVCGCLYKQYRPKSSCKSSFLSERNKYSKFSNYMNGKERLKYSAKINNNRTNILSNKEGINKNKEVPQYAKLKNYYSSNVITGGGNGCFTYRKINPKIFATLLREENCKSSREYEKKKFDLNQFRFSYLNYNNINNNNLYSIDMDKKFHKTQIFNHCKPYLVDAFQEFPD